MQIRTDQTVTGKINYTKSGAAFAHPPNVIQSYAPAGIVTADIAFISANVVGVTLHPIAAGTATVTSTGTDGTVTTEVVTVVNAPLVGTLVWDPPVPA